MSETHVARRSGHTSSERGPDEFYEELTQRNRGLIDDDEQRRLRTAAVTVAGCGSIGGSAVEPLVRLGAETLRLAEPDTFELHNLNRQNAVLADVGVNKAVALAARARAINPHAAIQVETRGVVPETVVPLLDRAALVIDGIDVTTSRALSCKHLLHVRAHERGVPVISGYDIAGVQMVLVYDYRDPRVAVLGGRLGADRPTPLEPLPFLAHVVPLHVLPPEIIPTLERRARGEDVDFPQLGYTAGAFGVIAARVALDLLEGRRVRRRIVLDVHQLSRPGTSRIAARGRALIAVAGIARLARTFRDQA